MTSCKAHNDNGVMSKDFYYLINRQSRIRTIKKLILIVDFEKSRQVCYVF